MRYEVGNRTHVKKCPLCGVEPAIGVIQNPLQDGTWFFNCDECNGMIKVEQALE